VRAELLSVVAPRQNAERHCDYRAAVSYQYGATITQARRLTPNGTHFGLLFWILLELVLR